MPAILPLPRGTFLRIARAVRALNSPITAGVFADAPPGVAGSTMSGSFQIAQIETLSA